MEEIYRGWTFVAKTSRNLIHKLCIGAMYHFPSWSMQGGVVCDSSWSRYESCSEKRCLSKVIISEDFLEVRVIDGEMKRNQQTLGICRARQKYFSQLRVAMLCCRVNIYKTAEAEPLVIHRNKRWQCEALSLFNAT